MEKTFRTLHDGFRSRKEIKDGTECHYIKLRWSPNNQPLRLNDLHRTRKQE